MICFTSSCIHQDDAAACFDRIIMNNAILSSRKYDIPDNACKINCIAQKNMVYKTQSKDHTSNHSYSNTTDIPIHGGGQGSGNGGTLSNLISIPLLEVIDKFAPE